MQRYKSAFYCIRFLLIFLVSCDNNYKVARIEYNIFKIDSNLNIQDDSTALAIISPYKNTLDSMLSDTIGYSEKDLIKAIPEGTLNNFIADLLLERANLIYTEEKTIDFCMINIGSIRKNLGIGVIKRSDIYELMPFDNELVILELKGSVTKQLLEYIAETGGQAVSGVTMEIKSNKPNNILINREAFDENRNYIVLTYDYIANGGDNMDFMINSKVLQDLNALSRDVIIEHISELNHKGIKINSFLDNRIVNEN